MSDYAKIKVKYTYSANSDYSDGYVRAIECDFTPDMFMTHQNYVAQDGSATTIDTSMFTTINFLLVKNKDDTNYVSLVFADAGAANDPIRVHAGGVFITTDVDDATISLEGNSGDVDCEIIICGT